MESREALTVTPEQIRTQLDGGEDWTGAGEHLGIPAGLAFMIATGVPADGSGVPEIPVISAQAPVLTSPQSLVNHRGHNPLGNSTVDAWVRRRAARELTR